MSDKGKYSFFIIIFFNLTIFSACIGKKSNREQWRHVEIYPKDKSQTITIITNGNQRYIIAGKHDKIPYKGFLLLDISKVDRLGDGISICWNDSGYRWKIASAYGRLIKNTLDSSKFVYYQPLGKYGEAVSTGYMEANCGGFLIRESLSPRGDLIVNYIK